MHSISLQKFCLQSSDCRDHDIPTYSLRDDQVGGFWKALKSAGDIRIIVVEPHSAPFTNAGQVIKPLHKRLHKPLWC
ncbi:hypothetical protein O9929_15000 [Vibrio lentus]|nr:hypothetical protein [Vibrio lentus]